MLQDATVKYPPKAQTYVIVLDIGMVPIKIKGFGYPSIPNVPSKVNEQGENTISGVDNFETTLLIISFYWFCS